MDFVLNLIIITADQLMLFIINLLVARHVGEQLFGDYSAATNALLLLATLITLGIDSIVAYYFPKLYLKRKFLDIAQLSFAIRKFLQPIHVATFSLGLLFAVTLIALAQASKKLELFEMHHPLFLFLWGTISISLYRIFVQFYRSINYMRTAVVLSFVQTLIYFIFALLIYFFIHDFLPERNVVYFPHFMLMAFVGSYFLTVGFCYLLFNHIANPYKDRVQKAPPLDKNTYPWRSKIYGYMIQNLNIYVFSTIPLLVIEVLGHNEKSVGLFAAVSSIISLAFIAISPIGILISPDISAALADTKLKLKQTMTKYLFICFGIAFVITLVFGAFAKQILLLYKAQFIDALPYLYISLINIITYSINMPLSKMIQYSKHGSALGAKLTIYFIIIQIIACITLIQLYGIVGAIVCFVGINILYNLVMMVIALNLYKNHKTETHIQ